MALKAATQHFTYSTVSATSSQDSQPADCDWTVCYMLALSCGGVVQKKNLCDSKWKWHSVSGVCVWICVVVLRDPSTPPEAKKKITCLFFDLCDVTRTLSCSSQGLNICNDCVLNKPPSCFFLFKPSLLLLLYNHQVTTHTRMLYIELFIIKDCTLIFQSTYYMYKWRADRFQYFYPLNWAGTLFFFFFFCFIGKRTGKIYQGISCSILKWWRLEVKKKLMKMYVQGPTEKGKKKKNTML